MQQIHLDYIAQNLQRNAKREGGMKTITKLKQYIYHHTYLLQREDI